MKSFNDIIKDLDGAGSKNTGDAVEQLAKRLLAQGIAPTLMEAREKARSMVSTEQEVTRDYSQKKERLTQYNDPRSNPSKYRDSVVQEFRDRALNRRPVQIQDEFQTPSWEKRRAMGLPDEPAEKPKTRAEALAEQPQRPKEAEQTPRHERTTPQQPVQRAPEKTPREEPRQQAPPEEHAKQPEEKAEEHADDRQKKDLAKETGIDINDIFNYGKK